MIDLSRKTIRNKLTDPEKTAMINESNLLLKDDFIMYLRSLQRSEGTIVGYESDLLIFFTYILDNLNNKDFRDISKRDIVRFQNWLISNGNSSARIRRVKAAISSLSNYCENILSDEEPEFDGYRSIVRKIENPPLNTVREKTVWEEEELENLLNTLVENKEYDKACMVALAMYSGRRKSELTRFKVSDFSEDKLMFGGALYKSAPILTKGNKYLHCYTLAKKFKPYLDLWLKDRNDNGIESEWLFPSRDDMSQPISISTINSWTKKFSCITGRDFYMHSLRHYFVTALSKAGIPDNVVVEIVGWSSSEMFKIYNDVSKDEQISKFFSDGDINVNAVKSISDI